ncbi:hypothetical protein ACLB2K_025634 [Fragaria x ananassa]
MFLAIKSRRFGVVLELELTILAPAVPSHFTLASNVPVRLSRDSSLQSSLIVTHDSSFFHVFKWWDPQPVWTHTARDRLAH